MRPVAVKVAQVIGAWVYCFEAPTTQRELVRVLLMPVFLVVSLSFFFFFFFLWLGGDLYLLFFLFITIIIIIIYDFAPLTPYQQETIKNTLSALADVIYASYGYDDDDDWVGVVLAIKLPQSTTPELQLSYDDWDEMCAEHGFDYADSEATGRNEYNGEFMGFKN